MPGDHGVCCEIVYPRNVRIYTPKVLETWPPKCELHNDNNKKVNVDEKIHEASTLHKEQQATEEGCSKVSWFSSGKSTLIGFPVLTDHP